ncbi:hypothetical protein MWN34_15345 [Ancylobacter sp. 6x-1]|uniref:Peptidase M15 n=1 Tax=Ancylobacter crimeensis TaxID=2579147 RepID=A0ABT0DEC1_9HYPH|nr:hypothetical protein [Ancylobacter crimeensis]MCK0198288.1 hypothetical protein [Ancylobacter crimeensis]
MKRPGSVRALEELGRVRLSRSFFLRDFLYSEIASFNGLPNIPDDPDLAIAGGRKLCEDLLEPLQARFGRLSIRSAFRAAAVNRLGNERGWNCASNEASAAGHIWDRRDGEGLMGATACVVVNAFIPFYEATGRWEAMAWWVHDHLPYSEMEFFPRYAAFNLAWHEKPKRRILSYIPPRRGVLTKPGMANHEGSHASAYADALAALG